MKCGWISARYGATARKCVRTGATGTGASCDRICARPARIGATCGATAGTSGRTGATCATIARTEVGDNRRMVVRTIRRSPQRSIPTIETDICVVGAGMSGVSAALEAARLGRRVVIVDAAPALGGQAVGSIIGTIIGLYTHGERPYQITHGIADRLIADLIAEGSMYRRVSATGTITFLYDEVRLGRWVERSMQAAGVRSIVGAVLTNVAFGDRRVQHIELATRFGSVRVAAHG